jgi:SAM-dependent methyltransferase
VFLVDARLPDCDRKELAFWAGDPRYNRASSLWENLKVKAGELRVFEELLPRLAPRAGERILELGAGQAWASLMLKRQSPACEVHASELSPEALLGAEKWERVFETRLDGYWACQADHTPFADRQFDQVFTFAAFHHFTIGDRGRSTLAEALRILKPGGRLTLLYEPCAPGWLHGWSKRKLDRIRDCSQSAVEEEVLVPRQLARWARELGARMRIEFDTSWSWREIRLPGVLRNAAVRAVPALGWHVPIGAHLVFEVAP